MMRHAVKWGLRLLSLGLLTAVLGAVAVLVVIPRATHGTAMTVLTGSMTPDIPIGSVVIDRPVDPGTLHVGDIATYQKAPGVNEYITHRIVKIDASKSPTMFTFKGDANRGADITPVPAAAIRGKVWFHVPYLGAIRDAIHTKGGMAGIGMILLAIYAMVQLTGGLKERRAAKSPPPLEDAIVSDAAVAAEARMASQPEGVPAQVNAAQVPAAAFASVVRERLGDERGADSPMVILATLPTSEFDGISPAVVSRLLRGTLVETTDTTFTVLAVEDPRRSGDTVVVAHELSHPVLGVLIDELSPSAAKADVVDAEAKVVDLTEASIANAESSSGDLVASHV